MPVRNRHFDDSNAGRNFPLADDASALSDAGTPLPTDILVDARIRFPETFGRIAFLSALSVTEHALSLVVNAAAVPARPAGALATVPQALVSRPLASLNVALPTLDYTIYTLTPWEDGVVGWVVFGPGARLRRYQGVFSDPAQAGLVLRAARSYPVGRLAGLGVEAAAPVLTGTVELVAAGGLEFVEREIDLWGTGGNSIDVNDQLVTALVLEVTDNRALLEELAGTCGRRPEEGNCPRPLIESIGSVFPDADGVVTLEFQGDLIIRPVADDPAAAVLESSTAVADLCQPDTISADGLEFPEGDCSF